MRTHKKLANEIYSSKYIREIFIEAGVIGG